jgi:hypothetical protein
MRRNWVLTASLVLAISLFAGSSAIADELSPSGEEAAPAAPTGEASPLDATCNSGHVCVWPESFYVGTKGESLCTGGAHPLAGSKKSGKNRCANKAVWYRQNGVALDCDNAGEDSPSFGFSINELWIGAEGSHC